MDKNPFVGKKELLDELLGFIEAKGVNAAMLYAWAAAKDFGQSAQERTNEIAHDAGTTGHSIKCEIEMTLDCILDEGVGDYVHDQFVDALYAAEVMYGSDYERNLIPQRKKEL